MKGESIVINTKIAEAIEVLTEALRTDEGYWDSWKANLAMAIYDQYLTVYPELEGTTSTMVLHEEVFNKGAERFLKQLTYKPK